MHVPPTEPVKCPNSEEYLEKAGRDEGHDSCGCEDEQKPKNLAISPFTDDSSSHDALRITQVMPE